MSKWKEILKIDAHIHLTPDNVIEANSDFDGKFIINGSAKDYINLMEKYKIEKAFIMPFNDPYMLSMEFTIEAVHNNMLQMSQAYEEIILCFADIDFRRDISETLKEFDRVFENEIFIGIKIHPTNTGYPIDGLYYDKIFDYAERNNILFRNSFISKRSFDR